MAGVSRHGARRRDRRPARRHHQPSHRGAADREAHALGSAYRRVREAGAQRGAAARRAKWCRSRCWASCPADVTCGHRFHAPRPISLKSPKSYEGRLRRAKVIADFGARRERSARASTAAAAARPAARALIDGALLDEVTALVEWPVPIVGRFEAAIPVAAARSGHRHHSGPSALFRHRRRRRQAHRRVRHGQQHREPRPRQGARRQRARGAAALERRGVLLGARPQSFRSRRMRPI